MRAFSICWPETPEETHSISSPSDGIERRYHASCVVQAKGEVSIFGVFVHEYSTKVFDTISREQLLEAHVFGFKKFETNRKRLESGPNKYPGFDIASRMKVHEHSRVTFGRRHVVLAGMRLFDVSVSCSNEESLNRPEVQTFFQSFAISDEKAPSE
jgi:hypothetical protein